MHRRKMPTKKCRRKNIRQRNPDEKRVGICLGKNSTDIIYSVCVKYWCILNELIKQTCNSRSLFRVNGLITNSLESQQQTFNLNCNRVNGRISDRAEIRTPNFKLQYILQLYSKNLTIVLKQFTGAL